MQTLRIERVTITEDARGLKVTPVSGLRIWIEGPGGMQWIEGDFEPWIREWLAGDEKRLTVMAGDFLTVLSGDKWDNWGQR